MSSSRKNQLQTKLAFSTCKLHDLILLNNQLGNLVSTYTNTPSSEFGFSQFVQVSETSFPSNIQPNLVASRSFCDNRRLGFAHIGPIEQAFKGFFGKGREAGKEKAEPWGALRDLQQQLSRLTALFLGLGEQPIKFEVSSWKPGRGETIAVLVSVSPARRIIEDVTRALSRKPQQEPEVHVSFSGSEIPVFATAIDSNLWRALVPTTPLDNPGPRSLKVEVAGGRHETFDGFVEVLNKEYPVESIWLPKTKSKIRGTSMEKERVGAFISTVSDKQIWRGPFIVPSDGEVTTGYGLQRYYNGVFAQKYYHRGVDYGAYEGDPVRAPANGQVVLVGKEKDGFEIHGNCVGLDHGQGVTSILMHLNSSFVREGELVQAGQIVGTVGETGIATGPHLHWGLYVHGEAVDPHPWMQTQKWV